MFYGETTWCRRRFRNGLVKSVHRRVVGMKLRGDPAVDGEGHKSVNVNGGHPRQAEITRHVYRKVTNRSQDGPHLSWIEKQTDMYVSCQLINVEAIGGNLELIVRLPSAAAVTLAAPRFRVFLDSRIGGGTPTNVPGS